MRYQIHLINNPNPLTVEATEFQPIGTGVIFYKDRMRNTLGNDTWGNPRRVPALVAIAYMTNIESILEIPEEEGPVAEGVDQFGDFQQVPHMANAVLRNLGAMHVTPPTQFNHVWVDETGPQTLNVTAPTMDDDGVAWDAQRNE